MQTTGDAIDGLVQLDLNQRLEPATNLFDQPERNVPYNFGSFQRG